MSAAVMMGIRNAEAEAEIIVRKAQQEAKERLIESKNRIAGMIEKSISNADSMLKGRIINVEQEMKDAEEIILGTIDKECKDLKEKAQSRMNSAIDIIVGRIVK
jgi:V/A-type H+-transporting ATPase subunit G/H